VIHLVDRDHDTVYVYVYVYVYVSASWQALKKFLDLDVRYEVWWDITRTTQVTELYTHVMMRKQSNNMDNVKIMCT